MTDAGVPLLIAAVRRRLWLGRLAAALRLAAWVSAATMLLAAGVHLARPVGSLDWLAPLIGLPGLAAIAWAGARRPRDEDCALWADRHLDGASAYTTWLQTRTASLASAPVAALQAFEGWTSRRVPESLLRLSRRQAPPAWTRPTATWLVCAALAAVVFSVVEAPAPGSPAVAAAVQAQAGAPLSRGAQAPLVADVTRVLRAQEKERAARRSGAGRDAAGQAGRAADADRAPPVAASAGQGGTSPDSRPPKRPSAGIVVAAAGSASTAPGPGSGGGREAGTGADPNHLGGDRRAQSAPQYAPQSAAQNAPPTPQRPAAGTAGSVSQGFRADAQQSASFVDGMPASAAPRQALAGVAAATPPPAADDRPLSPSETHYVQAWMKASVRLR